MLAFSLPCSLVDEAVALGDDDIWDGALVADEVEGAETEAGAGVGARARAGVGTAAGGGGGVRVG